MIFELIALTYVTYLMLMLMSLCKPAFTMFDSKVTANEFLQYLNSCHNSITFTTEFERGNEISFSDILTFSTLLRFAVKQPKPLNYESRGGTLSNFRLHFFPISDFTFFRFPTSLFFFYFKCKMGVAGLYDSYLMFLMPFAPSICYERVFYI